MPFTCLIALGAVTSACSDSSDDPTSPDPVQHLVSKGYPTLTYDPAQPLTNGLYKPQGLGDWSGFNADRRATPRNSHDAVTTVSAGLDVCLRTAGSVTIDAIEPVRSIGQVSLVAAVTHMATSMQDFPQSFEGTPQHHWPSDTTVSPIGERPFGQQCSPTPISRAHPWQELIITLRSATSAGGAWQGVSIEYHDHNRQVHVLQVPLYFGICGTANRRFCS